jgi:DNA recombination protein RmuC
MAVAWVLLGLAIGAAAAWLLRDLSRRQAAVADLVAPVRDGLARLDARLLELDRARSASQGELREQVRALGEAHAQLRDEAARLGQALRNPVARGRWGEVQLRRVVELAGMSAHCDFAEQVTSPDGRLRPDLVVRLPGGRQVVVDAKAPLAAYLEATDACDEAARRAKLAEHARRVREHVVALSRKAYWEQFRPAPEFVVLFLPGESFFAAALEQDPALLEAGAERNVVLATPTTLIALLRAVASGWRQEAIAENARQVSELGRELHHRLATTGEHLARMGRALGQAVEAYNRGIGTLESRVLVSARRLAELGAATGEPLAPLEPVEASPRELQATELLPEHGPVDPARRAG